MHPHCLVAVAGACLAAAPALAQYSTFNTTLRARVPLTSFSTNPSQAADCWGYTSPSGREYGIIALSNGTGFVEITNPASPVVIATIPATAGSLSSSNRDATTIGSYCYGVTEGGGGLQVMNLAQIDSGSVTLAATVNPGGMTRAHTLLSNPASGYLYMCGANTSNGGLVALSLTNPTAPTVAGAWTTRYVHEALPISYTSGPMAGREIVYCFNGAAGIDVIDATNKAAMVRIGGIIYPQTGYCHQGAASDDLQYLFVNDEADEQNFTIPTRTIVINIANPAAPTYVGSFTNGLASVDHNLSVRGRYVYESNYSSGMRVWDIAASVSAPTEVAWIDTYPANNNANFSGAWGNYPFFASGNILISDRSSGLFIVRLTLCYPNCDGSTSNPTLTANDFQCFLNKFAQGETYANCDGSTSIPTLTSNDFQCFLDKYASGCP